MSRVIKYIIGNSRLLCLSNEIKRLYLWFYLIGHETIILDCLHSLIFKNSFFSSSSRHK